MADTKTLDKEQSAAETRPIPSKAEGDENTVDESLKQKEEKERK
jgi:hypothetical protein